MAAFFVAPARASHGGGICAPRDEIVQHLFTQYGEARIALALTVDGALLEVFAAEDGTTYSITVTGPGGTTCLRGAGYDWQPVPWSPPTSAERSSLFTPASYHVDFEAPDG